jgi:hypothetical protein
VVEVKLIVAYAVVPVTVQSAALVGKLKLAPVDASTVGKIHWSTPTSVTVNIAVLSVPI